MEKAREEFDLEKEDGEVGLNVEGQPEGKVKDSIKDEEMETNEEATEEKRDGVKSGGNYDY